MAGSDSIMEDNPLYDCPTLSDIMVRQTFDGESRDYKLHKAILASQSKWFYKAFAGDFKEATAQVLEVHDDEPRYFEMILKCIYSRNYVPGTEGSTACESCEDIIGIYIVADKYGCDDIITRLPTKLKNYIGRVPQSVLPKLIGHFYRNCGHTAKSAMGMVFASKMGDHLDEGDFGTEIRNEYERLCIDFPGFARDVMLWLIPRTPLCIQSHTDRWGCSW